jgi:hypothetical protein
MTEHHGRLPGGPGNERTPGAHGNELPPATHRKNITRMR